MSWALIALYKFLRNTSWARPYRKFARKALKPKNLSHWWSDSSKKFNCNWIWSAKKKIIHKKATTSFQSRRKKCFDNKFLQPDSWTYFSEIRSGVQWKEICKNSNQSIGAPTFLRLIGAMSEIARWGLTIDSVFTLTLAFKLGLHSYSLW